MRNKNPRYKRVTVQKAFEMRKMYNRGYTIQQISDFFEVHISTVYRKLK